ncbi:MAG: hypothetical protein QNJ07_16990 [Woeseiaceae bacterium]|nr:hypothetical protein [Woeseiaceae bacterium]
MDELFEGLIRLGWRIFAYLIVDVLFELAIKGPGYLFIRMFKANIDPDGVAVVVTGILFWVIGIVVIVKVL